MINQYKKQKQRTQEIADSYDYFSKLDSSKKINFIKKNQDKIRNYLNDKAPRGYNYNFDSLIGNLINPISEISRQKSERIFNNALSRLYRMKKQSPNKSSISKEIQQGKDQNTNLINEKNQSQKRNIRVSTPKLHYSRKNPIYKTRVKELGLTNEDNVRSKQLELNTFLKARGLQELDPDGTWGEKTENAYQLFNSNKNLQSALKPTEVELTPRTITVQPAEYQPGTYNTGYTFNRGNIRANRGINYSNRDQYWNYINSNPNSPDAQLWNNVLGGLTNDQKLQAFNQIMDQYGIRGNLGRRDSGRLANLLNDLNLVGTSGSDARNSFLDSYRRNNRDIVNRTGNDGTIYSSAKIKNIKVNPENNFNTDYTQPIKYNFSTPSLKLSSLKLFKKGGKNIKIKSEDVCPKCKKIHKMGIGYNIVKKIKYQSGGGLPTAPKAEDRYKGGQRVNIETKGGRDGRNDRMEIKEVQGKKPGIFGSAPFIRQTVVHSSVSPDYNDTIYIEVPERKNFLVQRKLRGIERRPSVYRTYYSKVYPYFGSILPDYLGSGSKQEYETLKRRFNTAWNLAK